MIQFIKAKFMTNEREVSQEIQDFNAQQEYYHVLKVFKLIYVNYQDIILKFAEQYHCGLVYVKYLDVYDKDTIFESIIKQSVLERKFLFLLENFQSEMKCKELSLLEVNYSVNFLSDFRAIIHLNNEKEEAINQICELSLKCKYNNDEYADKLVLVLRPIYCLESIEQKFEIVEIKSVCKEAQILLQYRMLATPIIHLQLLQYYSNIEQIKLNSKNPFLRDPVFIFQLTDRLLHIDTTIFNVFRPIQFSIENLNLNKLFWQLQTCNSELSLYFHLQSLSLFSHESFMAILQQLQQRVFRENRPTSTQFYLISQLLHHCFILDVESLLSNANIYDTILCHIFDISNTNDEVILQKYSFNIEEFESCLKIPEKQPLEWYPYPVTDLLNDLRFMELEDFLCVINPRETSVLNILFRSENMQQFIELMINTLKAGVLVQLIENITLPYDSSFQYEEFKDDLLELQQVSSPNYDITGFPLRQEYEYFKYVIEAQSISYMLDRLEFIIRHFEVKVPKIEELDIQVDEQPIKPLVFAVYYVKEHELTMLQPLLEYKDHIIYNLIQEIENEEHTIEGDWRKWENKEALNFIEFLQETKDIQKPIILQQQFQFSYLKLLIILEILSKEESKYQQVINKLGKETQQYEKYFGKQFAVYFVLKFLLNNTQIFKYLLYEALYDDKIMLLLNQKQMSQQYIMNLNLHLPDIQAPIAEVYYFDIYNLSLGFYHQNKCNELIKCLKQIRLKQPELFPMYLTYYMICSFPQLSEQQYSTLQSYKKSHLENYVEFIINNPKELVAMFPELSDYLPLPRINTTNFDALFFSFLEYTLLYIRIDFEQIFIKSEYLREQIEQFFDAQELNQISISSYYNDSVNIIEAFDSKLEAFSDVASEISDISIRDVEFSSSSSTFVNIE